MKSIWVITELVKPVLPTHPPTSVNTRIIESSIRTCVTLFMLFIYIVSKSMISRTYDINNRFRERNILKSVFFMVSLFYNGYITNQYTPDSLKSTYAYENVMECDVTSAWGFKMSKMVAVYKMLVKQKQKFPMVLRKTYAI